MNHHCLSFCLLGTENLVFVQNLYCVFIVRIIFPPRGSNGIFLVIRPLIRQPEKYDLLTDKNEELVFSKTPTPAPESTRTPIQ